MYARHFGLTAEAFALTPDPSFLYLAPAHAEALAALTVGLCSGRGLMVMTGEVGTGKTTLLYSLLSQLGTGYRTAYLSNTTLRFDDMLRQTLADFGVPSTSRDRVELLSVLNTFLRQCATEGTAAALVIDEAQNLGEDSFENLRLLSNFETFNAKLIQIVLVGQPELEIKLAQPSLRQVAERVAVHCHITPLNRAESRRYIEHRLQCVGGSLDLFTDGALRLVTRKAQGIPRRINILCHNALLFAYGRAARTISPKLVRAAARERGPRLVTGPRGAAHAAVHRAAGAPALPWLRPVLAGAGAALAAVGVIALIGKAGSSAWLHQTPLAAPSNPQLALPETHPSTAAHAGDPAVTLTPIVSPAEDVGADSAIVSGAPSRLLKNPAPCFDKPVLSAVEGLSMSGSPPRVSNTLPLTVSLSKGPASVFQQPASAPPANPGAADPADARALEQRVADGAQPASPRLVRVRRGATLGVLAKQIYGAVNGELLKQIQLANPQVVDPDRIVAGDTLRFPMITPISKPDEG